MSTADFTAAITVDVSRDAAFAAINDVRGWWSETIEGDSGTVGDHYLFEVPGVHRCTMTTTESVPAQRLVWHVTDSHLSFVADTGEWENTDVVFDLTERDGCTEIRFTHVGLRPSGQCYEACSNAWGGYLTTSLRNLIATGVGDPFRRGITAEREATRHGDTGRH